MRRIRLGRVLGVILTLAIILAGVFSVRAQGGTYAELLALDASAFPTISAKLDAYDASGNFVSGLTPGAVTLLEDNQPRPVETLKDIQPGVQFVVAINSGQALATRNANAVSRFDRISKALKDWATSRSTDTTDDLSLVLLGGTNTSHKAAAGFLDALSAYQADMRTLTPTLDTLSQALDLAAESTSQGDRKRAVLFVTPIANTDTLPTLQSLSARAVELKVRVYVWIVASTDYFTAAGATALKDLAINTGGGYFLFSSEEPLPSPETYLAPLRHTYVLTYTSAITTSGSHSVTVQLTAGGQTVTAAPLSFDLNVQPPNPILVSPPEQIVRQIPDPQMTDLLALRPTTQTIEIMVEFPDGHPRPLARTTLYVDGQKIAENTAEPFDKFTWDLSSYTTSGQHNLQVEALDGLGLGKVSLSIPVTVTVIQPQHGLRVMLGRNSAWVMAGAVLLAGALLAGILVVGGRKRRPVRAAGASSRGAAGRRSDNDPVTQPILPQTKKRNRPLPGKRQPPPDFLAYLVRLKADGQPVSAPPIPLTGEEVTFGSDPTKATSMLDDLSVAPLHARLRQGSDGGFVLSDEKSIAGTWVNYEQIQEPRRLQHGDVLHFGQISYRFMLRKPPEKAGPHLTPEKP